MGRGHYIPSPGEALAFRESPTGTLGNGDLAASRGKPRRPGGLDGGQDRVPGMRRRWPTRIRWTFEILLARWRAATDTR